MNESCLLLLLKIAYTPQIFIAECKGGFPKIRQSIITAAGVQHFVALAKRIFPPSMPS